MSDVRSKPAHIGHGCQPFGEWVYVVVRHDDKVMNIEPTRHDAVGQAALYRNVNRYRVVTMRVGEVRLQDWTRVFKQ